MVLIGIQAEAAGGTPKCHNQCALDKNTGKVQGYARNSRKSITKDSNEINLGHRNHNPITEMPTYFSLKTNCKYIGPAFKLSTSLG